MKKLFVKIGTGLVIGEAGRRTTEQLEDKFKYAWIVGAALLGVASAAAERFIDAWFDKNENQQSND